LNSKVSIVFLTSTTYFEVISQLIKIINRFCAVVWLQILLQLLQDDGATLQASCTEHLLHLHVVA